MVFSSYSTFPDSELGKIPVNSHSELALGKDKGKEEDYVGIQT